jgi:hypothetical protein
MPFIIPTFPTPCGYWDKDNWNAQWLDGAGRIGDPDYIFDGQLRYMKHPMPYTTRTEGGFVQELLVPFDHGASPPVLEDADWQYWCDRVEVPVGSGRFYFVVAVLDVAMSFSNQYRVVWIVPTYVTEGTYFSFGSSHGHYPYAPSWPRPIPHN